MIGISQNGMPSGTNRRRKPTPCRAKPISVTVIQTMAAKAKVTMMWLVTVKECGMRPNRLSVRMKMKIVNTQGKNFMPSSPRFSRTMLAMYS